MFTSATVDSAAVQIAVMSRAMVPAMDRERYDRGFVAVGVVDWVIIHEALPQRLEGFNTTLMQNLFEFLLIINLALLCVGMTTDDLAAIVPVTPILLSIAISSYGIFTVSIWRRNLLEAGAWPGDAVCGCLSLSGRSCWRVPRCLFYGGISRH